MAAVIDRPVVPQRPTFEAEVDLSEPVAGRWFDCWQVRLHIDWFQRIQSSESRRETKNASGTDCTTCNQRDVPDHFLSV